MLFEKRGSEVNREFALREAGMWIDYFLQNGAGLEILSFEIVGALEMGLEKLSFFEGWRD